MHIFRPAKFQIDPAKTVGGVRSQDFVTDSQTDGRTHGESNMSHDPDGGDIIKCLTHKYMYDRI